MDDYAGAFRVSKMKSGRPEVYLLKQELQGLLATPRRVDLCEWIAKCFYQLEQYEEAGEWFKAAGQMILSEATTPDLFKAMRALPEYEKALDSFEREGEADSVTECSDMLAELRRACAPA